MGAGNIKINQCYISGSEIIKVVPKAKENIIKVTILVPKIIFSVSRAICKIKTSKMLGSGFLIKFYKEEGKFFFCLMSCEHVIEKKLIEKKEKISFKYDNENKEKEIILDQNERFIKDFTDMDKNIHIDATVVEIIESDKIDDEYFLLPDIDYMNKNKLSELNKEKILVPQYPEGGDLSYSKGTITKVDNYQLTHKCSTKEGSSGSPLLLKDKIRVLGIHKQGNSKLIENYADSIEPIFNFFIKDINYILKENDNSKEDVDLESKISLLNDKNLLRENSKLINFISYNENNNEFDLVKFRDFFLSEKNPPRVLKIYSNKDSIELIDKRGHHYFLKIFEFFEEIKYKAKKHIDSCRLNTDGTYEYLHYYSDLNSFIRIPLNKLGNTCLIHNKEISIYCTYCESMVCNECFEQLHKKHIKSEINGQKIKRAKNEIIRNNIKLSKLKEFYELIRLTFESNPNNNIYKKNIINISKSIEREKRRNKYDKDLAIYRIEQIKNKIN